MAPGAYLALITAVVCAAVSSVPTFVDGKDACSERQFQCGDGRCIPLTWACEGEPDCADGSDETSPICKGIAAATQTTATADSVPVTSAIQPDSTDSPRAINMDDELRMSQRLPMGGVLEDLDALRIVGMVRKLPFQFLETPGGKSLDSSSAKEYNNDVAEPRSGRAGTTSTTAPAAKTDDVIDEEEDFDSKPDLENRRRKQKPKRPTPPKKQGNSDDLMRQEMARVNLDVLRRLAAMLGEEREKFMAERQMLSASRDMMMAEKKKVDSEKTKIDAEKLKVDIERDLLQGQMLGRRNPRFGYLSNVPTTVTYA